MSLAVDLRLRYTVDSDKTAGFASIHDLRLGDLTVSSRVNRQWYLDAAWAEIEAKLSMDYVVPIPDDVPEHTASQLALVHTYFASSQLLMELSGGTTDDMSFAAWMRAEGDRQLGMVCSPKAKIDGLERRIDQDVFDADTGLNTSTPGIYLKDTASAFDRFANYTTLPASSYGAWSTDPFTPGDEMTEQAL